MMIKIFFTGLFILSFAINAYSLTREEIEFLVQTKKGTHLLSENNPGGCKTCHAGIRYSGSEEEVQCYTCHGPKHRASKKLEKMRLNIKNAKNVAADFDKPYRHPVERKGLHKYNEVYPVTNPDLPRHSECLDCHSPHDSIPEVPHWGVSGVNIEGKFVKKAYYEYEVCFKCHGADANKPFYQKNKLREFNPNNPSYHPVVAVGKNNYLPSLKEGITYETMIKCSSCHGSDTKGGKRVEGVHGSNNDYILILPYTKKEETLIPNYDLCYSCHRKESILGNESFPYHREHIEGVKVRNWKGTSCSTCHSPHGSEKNKFLIEFNPDYVKRETTTNKIEFKSEGIFRGSCYLKCHDVEHSPKVYAK